MKTPRTSGRPCRTSSVVPMLAGLAVVLLFTACEMPRSEPQTVVAALAPYATARAAPLAAEGVEKVVVWSNRPEQPVQVITRNGAIYFPWPPSLPFAAFAVDVRASEASVRADGYADAERTRFAAAIDFALAEAQRLARDNNARLATREKASP